MIQFVSRHDFLQKEPDLTQSEQNKISLIATRSSHNSIKQTLT